LAARDLPGQMDSAGERVRRVDVAGIAADDPPPVAGIDLLGELDMGVQQRVVGLQDPAGLDLFGEALADGPDDCADQPAAADPALVGGKALVSSTSRTAPGPSGNQPTRRGRIFLIRSYSSAGRAY
jgi:hypothetical protein